MRSGEFRTPADQLDRAFGRSGLVLATDDIRILTVRFSGKRHDASSGTAHVDIASGLPGAKLWRRS